MSVFSEEIARVKRKVVLKRRLLHLCPFLDNMRFFVLVGEVNIPKSLMSSVTPWSCQKIMMWPNWLSVQSIYVSCMQACLLVSASLSCPFYIVRNWSAIRSITRSCVICSRVLAKVQCQLLGQFPADWLTPDPVFPVFQCTWVDYTGTVLVKRSVDQLWSRHISAYLYRSL